MNIKLVRLAKKLDFFRMQKFYNRGWAELGGMIQANGGFFGCEFARSPEARAEAERHIKRSNWIYNCCAGKGLFKGDC
jgi:hypothetical protein